MNTITLINESKIISNMFNWLRKKLGITDLEDRLNRSEKEKIVLENRIITTENENQLIISEINQDNLSATANTYLERFDLTNIGNTSTQTSNTITAIELVNKYQLTRFVGDEIYAPSTVITIKDLQEHPEIYLNKINKGIFNFPIGLNFDGINQYLSKKFNGVSILTESTYSHRGTLGLYLKSLFLNSNSTEENQDNETNELILSKKHATSDLLKKTLEISNLDRSGTTMRSLYADLINIDLADFLANSSKLEELILGHEDLLEETKEHTIKALEMAKLAIVTGLEVIGTSRIRDTKDLLTYQNTGDSYSTDIRVIPNENLVEQVKYSFKETMFQDLKGTTFSEIERLVPIGSKERFRELASLRTKEILAKDKKYQRLTDNINKPINEYSVGESVFLACYFARNIIDEYKTLDDNIKSIFSGKSQDKISGKCTDYTGLALHYLREYLVPLQPETFKGWIFGFDSDHIGDYKHCYLKAIHVNQEFETDVYFADSTQMANSGLDKFTTPQAVAKAIDASNLPIQIKRNAEDLISQPIK